MDARRIKTCFGSMLAALLVTVLCSSTAVADQLREPGADTSGRRPPAANNPDAARAGRNGPAQSLLNGNTSGDQSAPSRTPERARSPMPTPNPTSMPPSIPAPTGVPDPNVELEAARARAEQMQALSQQHASEMSAASQEFQAKMRAAQTPAERTALQQEFQQTQKRKQEELRRKLSELKQH